MNKTIITSTQNQYIKDVCKLHKASIRKTEQLAFVEGSREVSIAQQFAWEIDSLLVCEEIYRVNETYPINFTNCNRLIYVNTEVYRKVSYRDDTEGVCAVIRVKENKLNASEFKEEATVLVLESLEKPGNIGAILRSADAAGVDAVILANPLCDAFNPNVIRSSLGCVFTLPIYSASTNEVISILQLNQFTTYIASLQAETNFYQERFTGKTALVFGSEANGLTTAWYEKCKAVKIPMKGKIDSLNVSASAAIMLFEVQRQKVGRV